MYKERNIQRRKKWPTYMGDVNQSGKKFLIFHKTTENVQKEFQEQLPRCLFDQHSKMFDIDFPALPRCADKGKRRAKKKMIKAANVGNSARWSYADAVRLPAPAQKKTKIQSERKRIRQREKRRVKRAESSKTKASVLQDPKTLLRPRWWPLQPWY